MKINIDMDKLAKIYAECNYFEDDSIYNDRIMILGKVADCLMMSDLLELKKRASKIRDSFGELID